MQTDEFMQREHALCLANAYFAKDFDVSGDAEARM